MSKELRLQLTEVFLKEAGVGVEDRGIIKQWHNRIWLNPFSKTSVRLSQLGHTFLVEKVRLECYTYNLKDPIPESGHIVLQLNKHLTTPFYLHTNSKITFFGEKDAFILALLRFDLAKYLQNLVDSGG